MARARGQLEHEVMQVLWDSPDGSTARDVVDRLDGAPAAITTVLTILSRLGDKGLVQRLSGTGGGHVYRAVTSRDDGIVDTMLLSLGNSSDRQAALLRFAGELDATDAAVLRDALAHRGKPRRGRPSEADQGERDATDHDA